jgi:hypothetical protein
MVSAAIRFGERRRRRVEESVACWGAARARTRKTLCACAVLSPKLALVVLPRAQLYTLVTHVEVASFKGLQTEVVDA